MKGSELALILNRTSPAANQEEELKIKRAFHKPAVSQLVTQATGHDQICLSDHDERVHRHHQQEKVEQRKEYH